MMKKVLPLTLVLIGAALLITAVVFWIDSSTSTQPDSFGKSLRDWITLILGIGASIKGWMDLFKKDKPTRPTTKIDVKGNNSQISLGDNSPNIQTETYIGTQIVQQPQEPKTPKSLNQLPVPPLDFIGREKELAQLHKNIEKGVLISGVQGMGGIGKTALGLKLAEQITSNYPDGQIYLDLRGAHEQVPLTPEQVMTHVIRSFHPEAVLPIEFGELGAMYRSTLNSKKALLFYDNARDANQLISLLPPKSCVLFVTSRQYFTLPGLKAIDLETLTPKDAIDLVQEIASKVGQKDAGTLAKQCGYLPLAIRAAVSVLPLRPDWSPAELIKRLSDNQARLGLVESTLSLSYDALDADLQQYLRQLGVFAAPFDKEAILAIWFDGLESRLSELESTLLSLSGNNYELSDEKSSVQKADKFLGDLLKTSLLKYDQNSGEYYFHDLIYLFLEEKCREDLEADKTLWRYAKHYLSKGRSAVSDYQKGGELVAPALSRFRRFWIHINKASERLSSDTEPIWNKSENAKDWLAASVDDIYKILQISFSPIIYIAFIQRSLGAAKDLNRKRKMFWYQNYLGDAYQQIGNISMAIEYYNQALAIGLEIGLEGTCLSNLGSAYSSLGKTRKAIGYYEQALVFAEKEHDRERMGVRMGRLGSAYLALGDARKALEYYEQALAIAREIGARRSEGSELGSLGSAYLALGDARKALEYYEQALAIVRDIGDRNSEGSELGSLGSAYLALGDARKALEYYEQALAIVRDIGDRNSEGKLLGNVGLAYSALGDARKAIEYYEQALAIARDIGDRKTEGMFLGNVGLAYSALGDARKAIEYYEQALAIAREIGDKRSEGSELGSLGSAYAALGDARKAIEYYEQALAIAREIGDKQSESIWTGCIGFISDASKNIDSGLQISQNIGDRRTEAYLICAAASKKRLEGSLDESIRLFEQALKISDEIGDIYAKGQILDNMGNTYADLGNQEKAIECYLNAMRLSIDEELTANIAWNLATVYNEQEQYELAAKYMQITTDFEQKISHPSASADLETLDKVRAKIQNSPKLQENS